MYPVKTDHLGSALLSGIAASISAVGVFWMAAGVLMGAPALFVALGAIPILAAIALGLTSAHHAA